MAFCIFYFTRIASTSLSRSISYELYILHVLSILYYAFKNDLFETRVTEISRLILIDTTGIRKEFSVDAHPGIFPHREI